MNEFWAAIAGAVVGAGFGGLISYLLQRQNLSEARLQRREEDKRRKNEAEERRLALGQSLTIRMMRIYAHLQGLASLLQTALEKGKQNLNSPYAWTAIEPIMNAPEYVHFETDELVMLLGLKDYAVFGDLVEFDERHNATLKAIAVYNERRLALTPLLPADAFDGKVGSGWSNDPKFFELQPRIIEVESIIRQIIPMCVQQEKEAWSVLERLQKLFASKIGLKITLAKVSEDVMEAKHA